MPKKIRPIRVEGNIAYVPLTRGYEAVIDASLADVIGQFNWRAKTVFDRKGNVRTVYAVRTDTVESGKRREVGMHRVVAEPPCDMDVDHRNTDGLDNRRSNLRIATRKQNIRNTRVRCDNKSGFKGVSWNRDHGKWVASIRVDGRKLHLGCFSDIALAADAYAAASLSMHAEFGRT